MTLLVVVVDQAIDAAVHVREERAAPYSDPPEGGAATE